MTTNTLGYVDDKPLRPACPRCRGRMFLEDDLYGTCLVCICCGFRQDRRFPSGDRPPDHRQHPSHEGFSL
nr:hypothetical protein [uncultured bacterium]